MTTSAATIKAPMEGIRVLDAATFLAAPFCGTILADFGAEVIKIEHPKSGDPLRQFGTQTECGDTLVWLSENRNKKALTLDLRAPKGAEIFRKLIAKSDVLIENFRPGTLEKWNLGFESLLQINPRLVMLRISGYGGTGPYRDKPGFARIAQGFSGLGYLAGEADGTPVVPGSTSLADYMSGVWGAVGVLLALRTVESSRRGQFVDMALYESVFRLLDELVPAYYRHGFVRERMGADVPMVVPHGHWKTADGLWIAIACSSDKMFARLANAMGRPELADRDKLGLNASRMARRAEVNQMIADWVGNHRREDLLAITEESDVPCGPLLTIEDIFADPHYAARENILYVDDPRIGAIAIPAPVPRLSETPAVFRHTGRPLGADTDAVLNELLGIAEDELTELRRDGVI